MSEGYEKDDLVREGRGLASAALLGYFVPADHDIGLQPPFGEVAAITGLVDHSMHRRSLLLEARSAEDDHRMRLTSALGQCSGILLLSP